jgi:hypothetical protein
LFHRTNIFPNFWEFNRRSNVTDIYHITSERRGMREKEERGALPRANGAVRLTEYDPVHLGGFVNRLDKETTSFFFTNIPEET